MIDLAVRHLDALNDRFLDIWYDPGYQYYFGCRSRFMIYKDDLLDRNETYLTHAFVSLHEDNIIGFLSYHIDTSIGLAYDFGLINFDKNDATKKVIFSKDIYIILRNIFTKFHANTIEFKVHMGNPIERSYDRICKNLGGEIVGVLHNRAISMNGKMLDTKIYEITREQFEARCKKGED